MTKDEIMRLADAYAEAARAWVTTNPKREVAARAALEAALTEKQEPCGCPPEGFCGKGSRCKDSAPVAEQEPVQAWEEKYGMKEWQVHALRAGWSPAPVNQQLLGALHKLEDACNDSDDCKYGTLSTSFVRDIARAAIAKAEGKV